MRVAEEDVVERILLKRELLTWAGGVNPAYHHYHPLKQKKSLRGSGEVSQTHHHYHPLKQKKSLRGNGEVN